jgi:hypothetical protein
VLQQLRAVYRSHKVKRKRGVPYDVPLAGASLSVSIAYPQQHTVGEAARQQWAQVGATLLGIRIWALPPPLVPLLSLHCFGHSPHRARCMLLSTGRTLQLCRCSSRRQLRKDGWGPGSQGMQGLPLLANPWHQAIAAQDLAGSTPLETLASSVPHGFMRGKLFEMLADQRVPLPRAIWFIQVAYLNRTK